MALILDGTTGVSNIQPGVVVEADIADSAVATAKLANAAVTSAKMATEVIPIGVGQTWQNVTSSRSLGVTYTNTTGRPIFINIQSTGAAFNLVNIAVDGQDLGYNNFNGGGGQSSNRNIVPAGSTYVVTMSGAGISRWLELR
jgi:hypothetical protein